MRIRYLSDLHIDINKRYIEGGIYNYFLTKFYQKKADCLVIAGDLAELKSVLLIETFLDAASETHDNILWVFGNHEYYTAEVYPDGEELQKVIDIWEEAYPKLTILHNKFIQLDGISIYGCTLWSYISQYKTQVRHALNDFNYIKDLSIDSYNDLHQQQLTLLKEVKCDIVITHHAPHPESISPKYYGSIYNQCYYSGALLELECNATKIWIHGHMHANVDYIVNNTNVLANPHGYGMENYNFDFNKIIKFPT